ncbi:MAG TPA: hypothetical protein VHA12_02595 [Candidatus Nanoarchaeia archaeon]|nr:hypothetical protein [Candidatus Nanoarchaeia archaeon]
MNLLFVCRYNCFRSRVAEAIFNNINKNNKIKVKSAGYSIGSIDCILDRAAQVLDEMKIPYDSSQLAVQLNDTIIDWADKVIIVANDVPLENFPREKTVKIEVPDAYHSIEKTRETIQVIKKEIEKLSFDLNKLI